MDAPVESEHVDRWSARWRAAPRWERARCCLHAAPTTEEERYRRDHQSSVCAGRSSSGIQLGPIIDDLKKINMGDGILYTPGNNTQAASKGVEICIKGL